MSQKSSKKRSTQKCPLRGDLIVRVRQEISRAGIGSCPVTIKGPTPGSKTTNPAGVAEFTNLELGAYEVAITLGSNATAKKYKLVPYGKSATVVSGKPPTQVEAYARPPSTLKVKVIGRRPPKGGKANEIDLDDVKIDVQGPVPGKKPTGKDGYSRFEDIDSGAYIIKAESLGQHASKYTLPDSTSATLEPGETKEVVLVATPIATLRLVLFDKDEKAISGKSWVFESSSRGGRGKTGADGMIEIKHFPLARGAGTLTVTMAEPKKPAPLGPPAPLVPPPDVPPYPPPVKAEDFTDKDPENAHAAVETVTWALQIGLLEDLADDAGAKERLQNLGYTVIGLPDGPALARKVKAYQKAHMKQDQGSGQFSDIKGHVINRHDNP